MSEEKKKTIEMFDKLKNDSNDKKMYIKKIVDTAIYFLNNRRLETNEIDIQKLDDYSNYIKDIIEEIYDDYIERSKRENNIFEDIVFVDYGFTTITFKVGDNVIKLGKSDHDFSPIKFDTIYKVPTYIREGYNVGDNIYFRVEVSLYVDTTNITYEDSYEAYKNIRKLGYIWNDPKEENIGRIINASGCKIKGKRYLPKYQYNKGDLVIIDLEDIAYVGSVTSDIIMDEITYSSYNSNVYIFENRYIEELKNKIIK
jgi:hypothetical protein